jgi:hypothetical protein
VPNMTRLPSASLILAGSLLPLLKPAHGQAVQYQFTPPPPIKTLPPSTAPGYRGVAPPVPAPRQSHLVPYRVTPSPGPSDSTSTWRADERFLCRLRPGEDLWRPCFQFHAGAGAGLHANQLAAFMGRCVSGRSPIASGFTSRCLFGSTHTRRLRLACSRLSQNTRELIFIAGTEGQTGSKAGV